VLEQLAGCCSKQVRATNTRIGLAGKVDSFLPSTLVLPSLVLCRRSEDNCTLIAKQNEKMTIEKTNNHYWRLLLLPLLLLLVLVQLTHVHGAGLRGTISDLPLWRSYTRSTSINSDIDSLLVPRPTSTTLTLSHDLPVSIMSDALVCTSSSSISSSNNECPMSNGINRTLPVCLYQPETQEYKTVCLKTTRTFSLLVERESSESSESSIVPASQRHPKSYCGVCKRCFQDRDELKVAIDKYQSRTRVDATLAETYGWPIGAWCVDKVTSFSNLFFKKSHFNEDISRWQTSQVTDMTGMFQNAFEFNQPLDTWDTSRVTDMPRMFAMSIAFNQPLSSWNVTNVQDMEYLFLHAKNFNQDLSSWQVHNAQNFRSMFIGADSFPLRYLDQWQISQHADTENMCHSGDNNINDNNTNNTKEGHLR
jgi:surface protein